MVYPQRGTWKAAFFRIDNIHRPDGGIGTINRHRGGNTIHGQTRKQDLHISQPRDGHAAFTELAEGVWMIRVIAISAAISKAVESPVCPCLSR